MLASRLDILMDITYQMNILHICNAVITNQLNMHTKDRFLSLA